MRRNSLPIKLAALTFLAFSLQGCIGWPPPPPPPGCEASYVKGSEMDLGGFKLPIDIKGVGTIEIGKLKYTGPQAQQLSDTAYALDVTRRGLCAVITSKSFETLSESYREKKFDALIAINQTIANYAFGLPKATTVDEGLEAARLATEKAEQIKTKNSSSSEIKDSDSGAVSRFNELSSDIKNVGLAVAALSNNPSIRLQLTGFELGSVQPSSSKLDALEKDFLFTISSIPKHRTPNVLVIGYADNSGPHNYNLNIALRRAQVVADFLRTTSQKREIRVEATSGGILKARSGEESRRVDVVISDLCSGRTTFT